MISILISILKILIQNETDGDILTTIIIDSREKGIIDKVQQRLKKKNIKNIDTEVKALDVGDFLITLDDGTKYLFERKTLNDFQNSIINKRLWNQLYKLQNKILNNEVDKAGLVITNFYFNKYTKSHIIYGALGSIYRRFSIDVLFFRSNSQFLDFIFKVGSKPKTNMNVKPEYLLQPLIGSIDDISEIDIIVRTQETQKTRRKRKNKDRTIETKKFPVNIKFVK